jgi:predicted GNAT superfamily acetyltransferase
MPGKKPGKPFQIHILETAGEFGEVENLQRLVWPGNETDIIPSHLLIAAVSNGGVVIGAYETGGFESSFADGDIKQDEQQAKLGNLVGFVFGFPGLYSTPDGPRLKHHSHMLGVHPDYRDRGLGFTLKRAQWQMVRHQGVDLITWTYDPLQSRNANLNIAGLGAVCDTYIREAYGEMRDGLNEGLPSDRFKVNWWINTQRVERRLSKKARRKLDLAHFLAAEIEILNPSQVGSQGLPRPVINNTVSQMMSGRDASMLLLEIPADFPAIKSGDPALALEWRLHIRECCEALFRNGYLVTDFIHLSGTSARSFYVLSQGMTTL